MSKPLFPRKIPKLYEKLYARAMGGKSRASGVKAMCLECQGWDDSALEAVHACADTGCPLHPYRPGSRVKDPKNVIRGRKTGFRPPSEETPVSTANAR